MKLKVIVALCLLGLSPISFADTSETIKTTVTIEVDKNSKNELNVYMQLIHMNESTVTICPDTDPKLEPSVTMGTCLASIANNTSFDILPITDFYFIITKLHKHIKFIDKGGKERTKTIIKEFNNDACSNKSAIKTSTTSTIQIDKDLNCSVTYK